MPAVKPTSVSAEKWRRRAGQAAQDYAAGVKNPRRSWQEATAAAAESQAAGVQEAIAQGRFEKGVQAAGDGKWAKKAASVGAQRFGPGVAAATAEYERGFAPYADTIQGITLPPRGPKGDPRNYERAKMIGEALNKKKTGG